MRTMINATEKLQQMCGEIIKEPKRVVEFLRPYSSEETFERWMQVMPRCGITAGANQWI